MNQYREVGESHGRSVNWGILPFAGIVPRIPKKSHKIAQVVRSKRLFSNKILVSREACGPGALVVLQKAGGDCGFIKPDGSTLLIRTDAYVIDH